jgi:hypothetical protein
LSYDFFGVLNLDAHAFEAKAMGNLPGFMLWSKQDKVC